MKKFGYIYKYSLSERLGILVFGTWKIKNDWKSYIKNTPILFSANDLLSEVSTGQLVYFDYDGKKASNIERASLSNFKVEYINNIIRCKDGESEYTFYDENTLISFECLDNIIIPDEDKNRRDKIANDEVVEDYLDEDDYSGIDLDYLDEDDYSDIDLDYLDEDDQTGYFSIGENDLKFTNEATNNLPESIIELFNCFGKYTHNGRKESTLLIVVGFGFKDKHIQNIIKEAVLQNQNFHLLVVCYGKKERHIGKDTEYVDSGITHELVPEYFSKDGKIMTNVTILFSKFKEFVDNYPYNSSYSEEDKYKNEAF